MVGEGVQVSAFLVVQPERLGEARQDGPARVGLLALFQPDVVVDGQPGQRGELFATQPGGAPRAGARLQADIAWTDARAPGAKEIAQLVRRRHVPSVHRARAWWVTALLLGTARSSSRRRRSARC